MTTFRLIRRVQTASSGFLEVHSARELGSDRTVLLKRVLDRREGIAERLHDGLKPFASGAEVFRSPDGAFLAVPTTEGESLRWVMGTLAKNSGFIAPNEGLAVVTRVAKTLDAAHRSGLIHGDVCPSTIFLTTSGEVLLHDAGVATTLGMQGDLGPARSEMQYVAPDQLSVTSARADVFRLGLLLYELAMGRPLWAGPTPAHVCHAAATWQGLARDKLQAVPEPWLTLLLTMLSPVPEDRPAMEEVCVVLEQAISSNRWSATPTDIARLFSRAAISRPAMFEASPGSTTQELILQPLTPVAPAATQSPAVTPPSGAVFARIATKKMTREELAVVKLESTGTTQPGTEKLPPDFRAALQLAQKGVLTRQQLETARSIATTEGSSLFDALVDQGADEDVLVSTLGDITKTPTVPSKKVLEAQPGADAMALITLEVSRAAKAIPLGLKGGTQLMVAMADPMDSAALDTLKAATPGKSLVTFRAGERALAKARSRLFPGATEMELETGGAYLDPLSLVSSAREATPSASAVESPTAELVGRIIDALLRLHGARGTQGATLVEVSTQLAQRAGLSPAEVDLARVASGAMVACALLANRQPWDVPKLQEVQDTVGFGSPVEAFVEGLHGFPARMPEKPVVRLVVLAFAFALHAGDARPSGARVQGALNSFKGRVQLAQPLFDALAGVLS